MAIFNLVIHQYGLLLSLRPVFTGHLGVALQEIYTVFLVKNGWASTGHQAVYGRHLAWENIWGFQEFRG